MLSRKELLNAANSVAMGFATKGSPGILLGAFFGISNLKAELNKVHNSESKLLNRLIKPMWVDLSNSDGGFEGLSEFASGEPQHIELRVHKGNVQQTDRNLNIAMLSSLVNAIDDLISVWGTLIQPIVKIIDSPCALFGVLFPKFQRVW